MKLNVKTLEHFEGLELPAYQTAGSAGLDLPAAVPADAPVVIAPGEWKLIPTGICIALPEGYEAQIRPRSGLAAKKGISCVNTPGTVDWGWNGCRSPRPGRRAAASLTRGLYFMVHDPSG